MNPNLEALHSYPFEKLARLKAGIEPPVALEHIALSIGEPKHQSPQFVLDALADNLAGLANYPATKGTFALRKAIADWLCQRFNLTPNTVDAERHILPVNGTREALFAFTQAVIDRSKAKPLVVSPNPFYQIYEGAAILAGAEPWFINCEAENGFIPDLDAIPETVWQRCQLLHLCSPGNPTGAVMSIANYQRAIELADQYDFVIASDECYSEIYCDESTPPAGLLEACAAIGRDDFRRCIVFHSLSKRSNLPGLRSGFVAGDAAIIEKFLLYRTYHGCAMSLPVQLASIAAWQDEHHVRANRALYREKFAAACDILADILQFEIPVAGFYLWPNTPCDDLDFARELYAQQNITVLPGQFLARNTERGNPGQNRIRMALVAELDQCVAAAERIRRFMKAR